MPCHPPTPSLRRVGGWALPVPRTRVHGREGRGLAWEPGPPRVAEACVPPRSRPDARCVCVSGCAEEVPGGAEEQGRRAGQVPGRAEEAAQEEPGQQEPAEVLGQGAAGGHRGRRARSCRWAAGPAPRAGRMADVGLWSPCPAVTVSVGCWKALRQKSRDLHGVFLSRCSASSLRGPDSL